MKNDINRKTGWWNKPTNHPNWWAALGIILVAVCFLYLVR